MGENRLARFDRSVGSYFPFVVHRGQNSLVYPGWETLGFILLSRRANGRVEDGLTGP